MATAAASSAQAKALATLVTTGWQLRFVDSFALIAFSILVYDHLLTMGDEIQYIWKKKITPFSALYIINRYFAPVGMVLCMVAIFSPRWTTKSYVRCSPDTNPWSYVVISVLIAEAMLILRVYAIYQKNRYILTLLLSLWTAQLGLMAFVLKNSGPLIVPLTPVTRGCVVHANSDITVNERILFVIPAMAFDTTVIFLLTIGLYRRSKEYKELSLAKLIFRDGILYFVTVFACNTAWTITGIIFPPSMQNSLALLCTSVTVTLVGRLTLNLRMYEPIIHELSFSGIVSRNVNLTKPDIYPLGKSWPGRPNTFQISELTVDDA